MTKNENRFVKLQNIYSEDITSYIYIYIYIYIY